MYNTGIAGFLAAACNSNRTIDTLATLSSSQGTADLSTSDIVSYKIATASTAGKAFTPGSFVAGRLELSLNASSEAVKKIDFKTVAVNSVSVKAGIKVNTNMVYVPLGKFYPEKDGVTRGDDGYVTVNATDIPPILYTQFDSSFDLSLPCTVSEALSQIAFILGIPITVSSSDFPNLAIELSETFELVTTYREALMYIAEVLGAFVHMGRAGEIVFKRIFSQPVNIGAVLDDNYLFSVSRQDSSVKPFQYIAIKATKDDLGVTQNVSGVETECEYSIIDNPLTYGHAEDFLPGLVAPTSFTEFYPSKVSFHGRPDLDVGDVLEYVHQGVTYILPVCSHEFEYNGGFKTTIESIGSDSLKTSSIDGGIKQQVSALKQNINSLVRDLFSTQSQITAINGEVAKVSELLQTAETLKSQISKVEGDITNLTTLKQTADDLRLEIQTVAKDLVTANDTINKNQNTLLSYFDFQADGLTIGISSSNIKLKLANNQIQFLREGSTEPVAYFSEGKLYVKDAHFLHGLVLGNFEFVPRSNGNLSLKRRG